jgi:formylglycine-generating enzyme required for sulfatase activity
MSRLPSVRVWVVFLVSAVGEGGRAAEPDKEKTAAEQRRIAALLLKLGDREYAEREAASKELIAIGEAALPAMRHAMLHSEVLEVSTRARLIARTILTAGQKSKSSGLELVLIDPGEFEMGSPRTERGRKADETPHRVRLDLPYLLGKYEVTQEEYKTVMGANPSWFSDTGGGKDKVARLTTARFPVEQVSWFDAAEFCNRLSKADGHPAYYELTDVKKDGDSITATTVKVLGGAGYRLPTEAEWEFACRAGAATAFHFGPTPRGPEGNFKMMVSVGYGGSEERPSLGRTGKAGGYKANGWDLFEMHGNAAEWCHDWYDKDYYLAAPAVDPTGPDKGDHRAVRGGSWMVTDANCRSAARFYLAPGERKEYVGFRVARKP